MKAFKYLSLLAMLLVSATSCMNEFEAPEFDNPPYGNNEIGEANTTIAQLKEKYAKVVEANSCEEVKESLIIEGVVVANAIQTLSSGIAFEERQSSVKPTTVKDVEDPRLGEMQCDERKRAYDSDAKSIRLR